MVVKDILESGAPQLNLCSLELGHSPFWSLPGSVVTIVKNVSTSYFEGRASVEKNAVLENELMPEWLRRQSSTLLCNA